MKILSRVKMASTTTSTWADTRLEQADSTKAAKVAKEDMAFGGRVLTCTHASEVLACEMTFTLYLPKESRTAKDLKEAPRVLYYLSSVQLIERLCCVCVLGGGRASEFLWQQ